MTINLSQHAGGGITKYDPGMMTFDGSTGYYALNTDLNIVSGCAMIARFKWTGGTITSAGGFNRFIIQCAGSSYYKFQLVIINDETGDDRAGCLQFAVNSSTNVVICNVVSNTVVSNGGEYVVFAAYNPSGLAQLYINGVSDINTSAVGYTITSGVISTGSNTNYVATRSTLDRNFQGEIGYIGLRGTYLTNPTDFYHPVNGLQEIDETTWPQWGGTQPLFWNQNGNLEDNKGSAGNMTGNGTITPAFINTFTFPILGLPTIGDAVAADIITRKVAWVDGVRIVGTRPAYNPGMMTFGSGVYYKKTLNMSTLYRTVVLSFVREPTISSNEYLLQTWNDYTCPTIIMLSDGTIYVGIYSSTNTALCRFYTEHNYADGNRHTLFFSFNASLGTATYYIDAVNADWADASSRVAPTAGIMGGGGSDHCYLGASTDLAATPFLGKIGFAGFDFAKALTNPLDFMDVDGYPKEIDTAGWTEWSGRPDIWSTTGDWSNNAGTAGNLTKAGAITGPD